MAAQKPLTLFTLIKAKDFPYEGSDLITQEAIEQEKKIDSEVLIVKMLSTENSEFLDSLADEYGLTSKNYFLYDKRYLNAPRAYSLATGKGRTPINSFLRPFLIQVKTQKLTTQELDFKNVQVGGCFFNADIASIIFEEVYAYQEFVSLL